MAIKSKYGYYPSNFDLESFSIDNNLPPGKVAAILHQFIIKGNRSDDESDIQLNAEVLRRIVGAKYNKIMECLLVNGIIENTRGYKIGEYSRAYKLSAIYLNCPGLKKYQIEPGFLNDSLKAKNQAKVESRYLADLKLPKIQRSNILPDSIFNERYQHLIKWFLDGKLTIDDEKAITIIENQINRNEEPDRYLSYIVMVDTIKENDFQLISDKNHRFYSNITNLPKVLRGCLLYNGEELIGIDVSNTQPLLLGYICEPKFLIKLLKSKDIQVDKRKLVNMIEYLDSFPIESYPNDLEEYRNLVEEGILYEELTKIDPEFTRDSIKKLLIVYINDSGKSTNKGMKKLRIAFKERFPTIAFLLEVLKSIDYTYSSSTLMTTEANLFIQEFPQLFYFIKQNQNIPIFTIHDCFMTTKSNIDYLEEKLKYYFQTYYKINLPLKREVYE